MRDVGIGIGRVALGDRGNGALASGFFHVVRKQVAHDGVARTAAPAAQHHADQVAVATAHRGYEIEAGRMRVTGLDAIDPFDLAQEAIMVADRLAVIVESGHREVAVISRKAILNGATQRGLIACRRHLFIIGQTRGVAIYGSRHAERARLPGHQLGEVAFTTGDGFRYHDRCIVGRARHQSFDGLFNAYRLARTQSEFRGRLLRGAFGHLHFAVEFHVAAIEALEQQIQSHDLGKGGRMTAGVRIAGGKRGAGVPVDDD